VVRASRTAVSAALAATIVCIPITASPATALPSLSQGASSCPEPITGEQPPDVTVTVLSRDDHASPAAHLAVTTRKTPQSAASSKGGYRYYLTTVKEAYRRPPARDRLYGDPGILLEISKGESSSISGSITGTTTAEAGIVFAKASVAVSISISKEKTVTTTKGGSWRVPKKAKKRGWLEMGALGYNITWYKKIWNPGKCKYVKSPRKKVKGVSPSAWIKHS